MPPLFRDVDSEFDALFLEFATGSLLQFFEECGLYLCDPIDAKT
jgi:hypothetical protein